MSAMFAEEYLTLKQVAATLQVDVRTIQRYARDGKLKVIRITRKNTRVARKDLDSLIKASKA